MTTPRRRRGEGTIFYDAKAKRWRGRLYFERKNYFVSGRTDSEVSDALAKLRVKLLSGRIPQNSNETVRQYLADWIATRNRLSAKTAQTYEGHIRNHITPALGHIRLTKLGPRDVQQFLDERARYLAPQTIAQIRAVLRKALNDAMNEEKLERNVARLVVLPRKDKDEIVPLSPAQARTFREVIRGHQHEALYLTAIATGLRQSELLGLRWEYIDDGQPVRDVDLELGILTVRYGLHRVVSGWVLTPPKSTKSRRTIMLPEIARVALLPLRERTPNPNGLVFTRTDGEPLWGTTLVKNLQKLLRKNGLPRQRFHDLRHLNASLMAAGGVSLKDASATLGHSSINITADLYQHLFDETKAEVARRMDKLFEG